MIFGAIICLALSLVTSLASAAGPLAPTNLRCEYLADPPAVATASPRLSWEVDDPSRGAVQSAYQMLVASSRKVLAAGRGDLWDTGRVASAETCQIAYAGKPLRDAELCFWKVRTWDAAGRPSPWSHPAHFGVGLLRPGDWHAQWVTDPTPWPPSIVDNNGYHSQLADHADAPRWVQVDLGAPHTFDAVRLYPAHPFNWKADVPGFLYPLRFRIDVADDAAFKAPRTVVDRTAEDQPNPGMTPQTYRFPPVTARYVRLIVTRLRLRDAGNYGFALTEMEVLDAAGHNLALHAPVAASGSLEGSGWSHRYLTDGDLIPHPGRTQAVPPPVVRRTFTLPAAPVRAVAYVTALGLYEMHINGRRVGDHVLAPGWTDYHKRIQYQAYDVTDLLRRGENAVGALLGYGWATGRMGIAPPPGRGFYGHKPRFLLQLQVELPGGGVRTIVTDGSWRATTDGPIRYCDNLDGEVYHATREMPGWDEPGFDDASWKPAEVVPLDAKLLVAQPNEPIRITRILHTVALTEPTPGTYIFDLGQNMVGWARLRMHGLPRGTTVRLRYGEMLNPDGTLYTANLRSAAQTDWYEARGAAEETFEPHFTYHGFRYVEVTGLPYKPAAADLVGCVFHSASPQTGSFECSSALLNRLWENILWTQRGNMMSVPTDCPQRDERMGWCGDIQAFSQTAIFNMDMAAFFTKWLRDLRDDQSPEGSFPDFAPEPFGYNGPSPAWGDAGTIIPWRCWVNYGDKRLLAESFEAARRWVDLIHSKNPDLLWRHDRGGDYGDWLNGDTLIAKGWPRTGGAVPKEILATAFFAHSADLVSRMALVLGRTEDAEKYGKLFRDIRGAFDRAYVKPDGQIEGDTQAGYALALSFNLQPDNLRAAAARLLAEGITGPRYHGHLSTGIQTTNRAMLDLSQDGYNDLAYRLIESSTFPSWGYTIENGATTIWERWDGYVKGRGFQNPGMNSFNHWALGSVGEWIYRVILGINPDPAAPGYRHFFLRPRPDGDLTWARGSYHSIRGVISVAWKIEGDKLALDVTIPANTTATVYVPTSDPRSVTEGGKPVSEAAGLAAAPMHAGLIGAVAFDAAAGTYHFEARR